MASQAQVNYLKSLIARADMSPNLYHVDSDTPTKAASWFIDKLKNGDEVGPSEWEDMVRSFGLPAETNSGADKLYDYDRHVFDQVLSRIKSPTILKFTEEMLNETPEYFYRVAASSTGKFHPDCSAGNGGLVRHTIAALTVAEELIGNAALMADLPRGGADMMRSAITLHDNFKHGLTEGKYTVFIHPTLPRKVYETKVKSKLDLNEEQGEVIEMILGAIDSHMGPWCTDKYSSNTLPTPKTPLQKLVHTCDYIASRKFMTLSGSPFKV